MCGRDVDLLDLVAGHHDEAGHVVADDRDRRTSDGLGRSPVEVLGSTNLDQLFGNVAEMAVRPAGSPDLGDDGGVRRIGGTDCHAGMRCAHRMTVCHRAGRPESWREIQVSGRQKLNLTPTFAPSREPKPTDRCRRLESGSYRRGGSRRRTPRQYGGRATVTRSEEHTSELQSL